MVRLFQELLFILRPTDFEGVEGYKKQKMLKSLTIPIRDMYFFVLFHISKVLV